MAHDNTFADAVWINIDETALPVYTGGKRGFRMRCKTKALENLMVERASLKLRRQYVTLIGAITSDPELQKVLPQVFMPKSKKTYNSLDTSIQESALTSESAAWHEWMEH